MDAEVEAGHLDSQIAMLSMMAPYLPDEVLKNIQNAERTFGSESPQFKELMKTIVKDLGPEEPSFGHAEHTRTAENHQEVAVEQSINNHDVMMQESPGLGFVRDMSDQDMGGTSPGRLHGSQDTENQPQDGEKDAVRLENYSRREEDTLHSFRNLRLAMEEKSGN